MPTLADIDARAKKYAAARGHITAIVTALKTGIDLLKTTELPKLRKEIKTAAEHHDALKALIADAPTLFEKPKTVIMHGLKLGYAKSKGKLVIADADRTVTLIKRHFPEKADDLIKTEETPVAAALNQLTVADLKKVGVTVIDATDEVVIKPVDSDVDKLVSAFLKEATTEDEA